MNLDGYSRYHPPFVDKPMLHGMAIYVYSLHYQDHICIFNCVSHWTSCACWLQVRHAQRRWSHPLPFGINDCFGLCWPILTRSHTSHRSQSRFSRIRSTICNWAAWGGIRAPVLLPWKQKIPQTIVQKMCYLIYLQTMGKSAFLDRSIHKLTWVHCMALCGAYSALGYRDSTPRETLVPCLEWCCHTFWWRILISWFVCVSVLERAWSMTSNHDHIYSLPWVRETRKN